MRACPNNDQLDFWNRCLKNAEWATRSKELYGKHKTWNETELGSCLRCYTVGVIADNCPECNSEKFTLYQCPNSRVINPMWLSVLLYASSEDEAKNLCRRPVQNNFHTWRSMGVPLSLREYLGKFEERLELLEPTAIRRFWLRALVEDNTLPLESEVQRSELELIPNYEPVLRAPRPGILVRKERKMAILLPPLNRLPLREFQFLLDCSAVINVDSVCWSRPSYARYVFAIDWTGEE